MRTLLPLALVVLVLTGCKPKPDVSTASTPPSSISAGGVAPMTSGAAGGLTPVSGGESVEGAGSGVGSSALDAAHRAAAKASAPPSTGEEGGG